MTILYDGVCRFCDGFVNFIIDHDPNGFFKFASLQSSFGASIVKECFSSDKDYKSVIVLKDDGTVLQKSDAVLEIAKHLKGWNWLTFFRFVPTFLRDAVYTFIARNRYLIFGKLNKCRVPTPEIRQRFIAF